MIASPPLTPTRRRGTASRLHSADTRAGLKWAFALQLGFAGASLAGFGALGQLGFPVLAVVIAVVLLRRPGGAYLEYVLWLWLLTPELRRITDAATSFHPTSPLLAVAPVASCLALIPALRRSRPLGRGAAGLFVIALLSIGYGAVVGGVLAGPAPAVAAILNWLPPVALGLYVANAGPDTAEVRRVLLRTAALGSLVLGGYGVVQFLVLPEWDRLWMINAELSSLGRAEPLQVRVFSVLNSPGPFATVMAVLLTMLVGVRIRGRTAGFGIGLIAFGLSLVRGAWLAFVVGALLILARSKGRGLVKLGTVLVVPVLLALTVGGPIAQVVTERYSSTSTAGARDQSLNARSQLYQSQTSAVLREPFGNGLGSVGTATKIGNGGKLTATGNFDSGLLEFPYTFGVLIGATYLLALLAVALAAWRDTRGRDDFTAACGAAVLGLLLQLLFVNITTAVSGVMLWVLLGFLLRREEQETGDGNTATTTSRAPGSLRQSTRGRGWTSGAGVSRGRHYVGDVGPGAQP